MARFDHPAMDLMPKYYSAIGEFIFRCAQLEYQLHELIWMTTGLGYRNGRIVTIGMKNKVLRGIIGSITATGDMVQSKEHIQLMHSLAKHARKFAKLRNRIAHGSWQSPDATEGDAHLVYMDEQEQRILPRRDESLDDVEINEKSKELRTLNLRAQKLIIELGGEPLPSQKTGIRKKTKKGVKKTKKGVTS